MSFTQSDLDDLAQRYTAAWNSKVPENVAAFHVASSSIVIKRGEPSEGHGGLTAMAAGFHADVPDLHLTCDGIRAAGSHVVYMSLKKFLAMAHVHNYHLKAWYHSPASAQINELSMLGDNRFIVQNSTGVY